MFDDRDEAIEHLTPNSAHSIPDARAPDASTYETLLVVQSGSILHVTFIGAFAKGIEGLQDLSREFAHMATNLERGSRVLLDFTGVESFDLAAIDSLIMLNKRLRNRGSRIVLCSITPNAKKSFFADASSPRSN